MPKIYVSQDPSAVSEEASLSSGAVDETVGNRGERGYGRGGDEWEKRDKPISSRIALYVGIFG